MTDSHCRDIGDYDALVIVQLSGFEEGELLLYERLQMTPMLLERYAKDGSEKSRRQMLAICQTDPEVLADVLGHFVALASEKLNGNEVCRRCVIERVWSVIVVFDLDVEELTLALSSWSLPSTERRQQGYPG